MRKLIATISVSMLMFTLTSCGYQGNYRYECQKSQNWDNPECNPPICEAEGTCSKDLVGEKTWTEYQNSKVKK